MNSRLYQFLVGLFASLGSFLFGYDLGVIGGVVSSKPFVSHFNNPSDAEVGAVVATFTGGAFFGAALAGATSDRIGRRWTIVLGAVIFCLGSALQTGARSLSYMYPGRIIGGLGVGVLVMIVPVYQAEIAHPAIRGRLTGLVQFTLGIGAIVSSYTTYGTITTLSATDNNQWRIPLGVQLIPAGLLGLLIMFFPESPRWLMDHDRVDEALQTLANLHARGDSNDPWVQAEFEQIKMAIAEEHAHPSSPLKDIFTQRESFRPTFLAIALQFSVQMTGVSAIQYFAPRIYAEVGVGTSDALKYQGIGYVFSTVAQALTVALTDKIGRRWPLILGNVACSLCFIVTTVVIAKFNKVAPDTQHSLLWLFLVFGWFFQFAFSFTAGSLSWIIPPELFKNPRVRTKGVAMGVMASFAANTMIGQVTAPAITAISWKYFILFIVCGITNGLFFYAVMPETKQRPLEEMDALFRQSNWFVPTMQRSIPATELAVTNSQIEAKLATLQVEDA